PRQADRFVWITGDALCTFVGPCNLPGGGRGEDLSEVHGAMGVSERQFTQVTPQEALLPYPNPGPATQPSGPDQSFAIDAHINIDASGQIDSAGFVRNDSTRIGDIAIYEPCDITLAGAPIQPR